MPSQAGRQLPSSASQAQVAAANTPGRCLHDNLHCEDDGEDQIHLVDRLRARSNKRLSSKGKRPLRAHAACCGAYSSRPALRRVHAHAHTGCMPPDGAACTAGCSSVGGPPCTHARRGRARLRLRAHAHPLQTVVLLASFVACGVVDCHAGAVGQHKGHHCRPKPLAGCDAHACLPDGVGGRESVPGPIAVVGCPEGMPHLQHQQPP